MTKQRFISEHQFEQQDNETFHIFNPDEEEYYIVFNSQGNITEEHGIEKNAQIQALIDKYLEDLHHQKYQDVIEDNYQTCGVKPQDFF